MNLQFQYKEFSWLLLLVPVLILFFVCSGGKEKQ